MSATYRFGSFTLDRTGYHLRDGEAPVPVSPKAMDLLALLVSKPARLVTKAEIHDLLWADVAVTDNALTQVISELRQALGDDPASPRYVETVPRRGYRFVAAVEEIGGTASYAGSIVDAGGASSVRSIGVMDFVNVSGDAAVGWLAAGIAETVSNDLRAIAALRVVDRTFLPKNGAAADASGAAKGIDLIVAGSFQRQRDQLRITARVIDVRTRVAVAQAKADGRIEDVFDLQDLLVTQLSAELRLPLTPSASARIASRETSSVEAYRALTEGRLKLERLDPALVPAALADFDRALALDPNYALPHVGLAHAHFWRFQASRAHNRPDQEAFAAAITHAKRAAELDHGLAEAHAALAFFLASASKSQEAVAAGRLAVAIEPANWRHLFRLGIAAWGEERLRCLDAVITAYPQLAYAYFAMAMVHVARHDLAKAAEILRRGIAVDPDARQSAERFPGQGLHWLLGMIQLASGDIDDATVEFERELNSPGSGLFADEFAMDAYDGQGFALLERGDAAGANAMFHKALERFPAHARSLVGLAAAEHQAGHAAEGRAILAHAAKAITELRTNGRGIEADLATAFAHMVEERTVDAMTTLGGLIRAAPPGFAGWTMPIEPLLAPLRRDPAFVTILATLSQRARS